MILQAPASMMALLNGGSQLVNVSISLYNLETGVCSIRSAQVPLAAVHWRSVESLLWLTESRIVLDHGGDI